MPFEPRNDLEKDLVAAQAGKISADAFMQILLESQVFLPVRDQHNIQGFQASDKAVPLTVEAEDGAQVLALFSSPDRAKSFVSHYPGFEGGLLAEFKWVLERTGQGVGIVLNPGLDAGFELEPEMVRQMQS